MNILEIKLIRYCLFMLLIWGGGFTVSGEKPQSREDKEMNVRSYLALVQDSSASVRAQALYHLRSYDQILYDTVKEVLIERIREDSHYYVRFSALVTLRHFMHFSLNAELDETFLEELCKNDSFEETRRLAAYPLPTVTTKRALICDVLNALGYVADSFYITPSEIKARRRKAYLSTEKLAAVRLTLLPKLALLLRGQDPQKTVGALHILCSMGSWPSPIVDECIRLTTHSDPRVSLTALCAPLPQKSYLSALHDEYWFCRVTAVHYLGANGVRMNAEAKIALSAALKDSISEVAERVAVRLYNIPLDELNVREVVLSSLVNALQSDYLPLRRSAVEALGSYGEKAESAIPALVTLLDSTVARTDTTLKRYHLCTEIDVQLAVIKALERIGPRYEVLKALERAKEQKHLSAAAIKSLQLLSTQK